MQQSLLLIKPDATARNLRGKILAMVEQAGFEIAGLKAFYFSPVLAAKFYQVHSGKPFFADLVAYMCSGQTVAVVVQANEAVTSLRKLIGATNPTEAEPGSIRNMFGETLRRNSVHGSDSSEHALQEISVLF